MWKIFASSYDLAPGFRLQKVFDWLIFSRLLKAFAEKFLFFKINSQASWYKSRMPKLMLFKSTQIVGAQIRWAKVFPYFSIFEEFTSDLNLWKLKFAGSVLTKK